MLIRRMGMRENRVLGDTATQRRLWVLCLGIETFNLPYNTKLSILNRYLSDICTYTFTEDEMLDANELNDLRLREQKEIKEMKRKYN